MALAFFNANALRVRLGSANVLRLLCFIYFFLAEIYIFFNSIGYVLFMNSHILFFSNFFIKNEFYGTIHTFKNYFVTVFFNFQFQFSVFSRIQTDPKTT